LKLNNETKVGILAAVAVTLLIIGFNLLKSEKIFVSGFELKSYYDNIAGLGTGNPVLYNGFRVGQVKNIEINKTTGKIEVRFSLDKGLEIPYDSKAVIANADLLGSKAIRIERGTKPQVVENGGTLTGEVEASLEERISTEILPLKDDIGGLINNLKQFVGWLNNTMDESAGNKVDKILDDFATTSRNFSHSSYRVDTLLGTFQATASNANKIVKNIRNQNETITRVMENTAKFTDSLSSASSSVKAIVEETSSMIKNLNGLMADVENGNGTLGKLIKDDKLYDNLNSNSARLDSLLEHFQGEPRIPVNLRISLGDPEGKERARLMKASRKAEKEGK
jgi:phospholipid/cholesterol/gamma-HCH transport system substrate-binding protein